MMAMASCCCSHISNTSSLSLPSPLSSLSSLPSPDKSSLLPLPSLSHPSSPSSSSSRSNHYSAPPKSPSHHRNQLLHLCNAAGEYVFPDPIPEFAEAETNKFRTHLLERLTKKKKHLFGDSIDEVVRVCTEIFSNFLHTEYGGPGTLLVIPFIDMADTLNERGLPGGPQAARAAVCVGSEACRSRLERMDPRRRQQ